MRNCWILIALLCLFAQWSYGQSQQEADRLRPIYEADTLQGEERMELLRNLAFHEMNDPDLAIQYANELIELAKELGNDKYIYRGYLQKGNTEFTRNNLDIALEAYLSALDYAKAADFKDGEATAYMSLGFVYHDSGELDRAKPYFEKSLAIARDPVISETQQGLIGLGSTIFNIGNFYLENDDLVEATKYLEEAGKVFTRAEFATGLYYVMGNQGILSARSGDYARAEKDLGEAIRRLEEDQDYMAVVDFQIALAEVYVQKEEYQKAHVLATESLDHAQRLGMKNQISETSLLLSEVDQELQLYKEAIAHLNLHMQYKDSTSMESVDVARLERENAELERDQTKAELEIQALNQTRQRNALWATGATTLLLIFLAIGAFSRYRYVRNTNKIISEEKDRSEALLLNILPRETAQELKEKGRVSAKRFDAVTVLFTDFEGFTKHAESLDPEKLIQSLDHYFGHFDKIMEKYGLEKIKTVGDAYMCASGLPFPDEMHAFKVVDAAFEMVEFMENSKLNSANRHIPFDIRIGINSGPVVAGVVGTKKFAYDIWGDTVNIASRMESTSEIGRINVAEGTYQLIKDVYDCEYRGKIDVKNRGKLNMYFVLGRKSQSRTA